MRTILAVILLVSVGAHAQEDEAEVLERLTGPSAWVTIPEGDLPVADAILLVAAQSHRMVGPLREPLEGKTWHSTGERMTFLQALDEVSQAAGTGFRVDEESGIVCGGRPSPVAGHDGGFRFVLDEMDVYRTRGPGRDVARSWAAVELLIEWEPHVQPVAFGRFEVLEATDDQGASLLPPEQPGENARISLMRRYHPSTTARVLIAPPSPGSRRVALFRGRVAVYAERDTKEIIFLAPQDQVGEVVEWEGCRLKLSGLSSSEGTVTATIDVLGDLPGLAGCDLPENGARDPAERIACRLGADAVEGDLASGDLVAPDDYELQYQWEEVGEATCPLKVLITSRVVRRDLNVELRDFEAP